MIGGRVLDHAALPGWDGDDHAAARAAFFVTADLPGSDWAAGMDTTGDARSFFERHFLPVDTGAPPDLLTGYYEPEVAGALIPDARFAHPLHGLPAGHDPARVGPARADLERAYMERGGPLAGTELVWLDSAIEAFLAQVQGSVRVRLADGPVLRLGYAGKNGQPYRSIGAELVRRGEVAADRITSQAIRDWCAAHPGQVRDLLWHNPSFVFFRPLDLPDGSGPIGAMGRPVTPLRTVAVDPDHIPLGSPVWVAGADFTGLAIAQDTGSAIKGAQRADLFCGSGAAAGLRANVMKSPARLFPFVPRACAERSRA